MRLALPVLVLSSQLALAHFILDAPEASFEQGVLGDPQKVPPCGESSDAKPTDLVTTFVAGQTVSISINETIFHPGHYRVAIGTNGPADLPPEPPVTADSTPCGSVPIDPNPAFPVLADGQLLHTSAFSGKQTFTVTLPSDLRCTNCTMQVLEFMGNHGLNNPGGCFYHHCATINVVAPDGGVVPPDGVVNGPAKTGCGCSSVEAGFALLPLWLLRRRRATAS